MPMTDKDWVVFQNIRKTYTPRDLSEEITRWKEDYEFRKNLDYLKAIEIDLQLLAKKFAGDDPLLQPIEIEVQQDGIN